jgi:hypothetical protein
MSFSVVTPCSSAKDQSIGGIYRLYLQGRRVNHEKAAEADGKPTFFELHSITTQTTILFIMTAVRTSNPANYWSSANISYILVAMI